MKLENGEVVTAHVPNTGSMMSTRDPGSEVALLKSDNPNRKLPWTLELVRAAGGAWVGVNTARPNHIVEEAIAAGRIPALAGYESIRREVRCGENSRIDMVLEGSRPPCYVEVKNVTYREGEAALFPDAVTARGTKHLLELERLVDSGVRAVIFFLVNRADCDVMGPARSIDPLYAATLSRVLSRGVEAMAWASAPTVEEIAIFRELEVVMPRAES